MIAHVITIAYNCAKGERRTQWFRKCLPQVAALDLRTLVILSFLHQCSICTSLRSTGHDKSTIHLIRNIELHHLGFSPEMEHGEIWCSWKHPVLLYGASVSFPAVCLFRLEEWIQEFMFRNLTWPAMHLRGIFPCIIIRQSWNLWWTSSPAGSAGWPTWDERAVSPGLSLRRFVQVR